MDVLVLLLALRAGRVIPVGSAPANTGCISKERSFFLLMHQQELKKCCYLQEARRGGLVWLATRRPATAAAAVRARAAMKTEWKSKSFRSRSFSL
jgi:hypothetical protein